MCKKKKKDEYTRKNGCKSMKVQRKRRRNIRTTLVKMELEEIGEVVQVLKMCYRSKKTIYNKQGVKMAKTLIRIR